ncbi:helix-turn-helix domain-containing protein [Bdellovibrionota bacterium FG-2]
MSERKELKRVIADFPFKKPLPIKRSSVELKAPVEEAPDPQTALIKSIIEESLSTTDTLSSPQCSEMTVSTANSVQAKPSSEHTTVSKLNTVPDAIASRPVERLQGNFTQVPNTLLRTAGMFEDPFDFMIYLLLYSYSYGFGRDTASMSQSQIENFAGVSKNRVKRSLDRLIKQRWIKRIGEFERSRVSRKWRVFAPEERNPGPKKSNSTVASAHTVQNAQSPQQTPTVFAADTVTLSTTDTFKERGSKNSFSNKALSAISENLNLLEYFDGLKPMRKRESELKAFEELQGDFSDVEIANCLSHLQCKGLPGRDACHSPMTYLARAMGNVLPVVKSNQEAQRRTAENAAKIELQKQKDAAIEARERSEWEEKERAFVEAFPEQREQEEAVVGFCVQNGFFTTKGQAARIFAIGAWSRGMNREESEVVMVG